MIVVGLDLSLTCTGLVKVQPDGEIQSYRLKPHVKLKGLARLQWIADTVFEISDNPDWVVVEGPSFGSQNNQQGHHDRAGLWWMSADRLSRTKSEWIVVAPTALKKYATGKGNASKDQVLAAVINRYRDCPVDDNNVADALVLASMGRDTLGMPLVEVPKVNREALAKVQWPASQMTQVAS